MSVSPSITCAVLEPGSLTGAPKCIHNCKTRGCFSCINTLLRHERVPHFGWISFETVQLLRLMFPKNPPRKQRISSKSVKSLLVTTLSELLLLFHHGWCTVADSGGNRSQVTLIALKKKCDLFHWISIEKQSKGFRISGRLSRQLRTDLLLCLLEIAVWGEAQCCDGTSHSVSFCIWEQDAWGITGLFERS